MSLSNILILSVFARHKWFTQKRGSFKRRIRTHLLRKYSYYSVSSTNQAAFFIGGSDGSALLSVIAKYENDNWSLHGNLKRRRVGHGSIISGTATIVIGGGTNGGTETEVWDFNNGDSKMVDPTPPNWHVIYGVGLYLVPSGYCNNS